MSVPAPVPSKPDRHPVLQPALLRAAVSPAAAVTTAAGVGIGALDHSIALAVILGAVGWTARMAAAVRAKRRRDRATRPHPADLDPWSVPEPWRQLLQQALATQSRFDQVLAAWPPGPTRDRLDSLRPGVYSEVAELGTLAQRGAAAEGWSGGLVTPGRPEPGQLGSELEKLRSERLHLGKKAPRRAAELSRREDALAAQLRALRRGQSASDAMQDRLRHAVARLDQTVTDLVTLDPAGGPEPAGVDAALSELSDGISTLRAALTETAETPPDPGTP